MRKLIMMFVMLLIPMKANCALDYKLDLTPTVWGGFDREVLHGQYLASAKKKWVHLSNNGNEFLALGTVTSVNAENRNLSGGLLIAYPLADKVSNGINGAMDLLKSKSGVDLVGLYKPLTLVGDVLSLDLSIGARPVMTADVANPTYVIGVKLPAWLMATAGVSLRMPFGPARLQEHW